MPRKQRFKPSRKPAQPTTTASPKTDERTEIHPDDVNANLGANPRRGQGESEGGSDPAR